MEVEGLEKVLRIFERAEREFKESANTVITKAGVTLISNAKLLTPVDSGVLRRSWQIKRLNDFEVQVFNSVRYAQFVNYGHRVGKTSKVVDGRYMLEKAVEEAEKVLEAEFEIIIENLFE